MQRRDHYRLLSSSEIVYHVLMSALIIYHLWLYLYSYLLASHSVVGGAGSGGGHLFTFIHMLIIVDCCTACWFTVKVARC